MNKHADVTHVAVIFFLTFLFQFFPLLLRIAVGRIVQNIFYNVVYFFIIVFCRHLLLINTLLVAIEQKFDYVLLI